MDYGKKDYAEHSLHLSLSLHAEFQFNGLSLWPSQSTDTCCHINKRLTSAEHALPVIWHPLPLTPPALNSVVINCPSISINKAATEKKLFLSPGSQSIPLLYPESIYLESREKSRRLDYIDNVHSCSAPRDSPWTDGRHPLCRNIEIVQCMFRDEVIDFVSHSSEGQEIIRTIERLIGKL